jgi:hypothetical protein
MAGLSAIEGDVNHALDAARDHLLDARKRAARFDSTWLSAWNGGALGNLAILQARPDQAAESLDEALRWSVTAHTRRTITLCVAAYSRLALALGDPERAALLAGAAEGLRRRAGLRPWPSLRQGELELLGTIRHELDAARFDDVFTAGTRLRQQEAVSMIQRWRGIAMDA